MRSVMKKLTILILVILASGATHLYSQDLLSTVTGKWKVVNYHTKSMNTKSQTDTLVFNPDGTFISDSLYFGAKEGLFRTDETRLLLVTETDNNNTKEWVVSLKKGILRLKSVQQDKRKPNVVIELVKIEEEKTKKDKA